MRTTRARAREALAVVAMLALVIGVIPAGAQDVRNDPEKDWLTAEEEVELGTDPKEAYTDVAQWVDGFEARQLGPTRSAATPTPTREPVTQLPDAGGGDGATSTDERNWIGVGIMLAIAVVSLVAGGRRRPVQRG